MPQHEVAHALAYRQKGGIIIIGNAANNTGEPVLHVVAPWVQGAFSDDSRKAYCLPKGSMDAEDVIKSSPNEPRRTNATYWRTAVREVMEETGIDIGRIYNPANPEHQALTEQTREKLFNHYPEVQIERILQTPIFDGDVPSNRGNPMHTRFYVVQVKGIEHLTDDLKHLKHNHTGDNKVRTTAHDLAREEGLPKFKELLRVMRTGYWNLTEPAMQLFDENESVLAKVEEEYGKIKSAEQFDEVYAQLSHKRVSQLKDQFDLVKSRMTQDGLVGDEAGLKIGNKHMPLRYMLEGADIIPYEDWIQHMIDFAKDTPRYRDIQANPDLLDRDNMRALPASSYIDVALAIGTKLEATREMGGLSAYNNPHTALAAVLRDPERVRGEVAELTAKVRALGDDGSKYQLGH